MAVDFSEFTQKTSAQSTDYIVGYDVNASGGEKKYTVSTLANAVSSIISPITTTNAAIRFNNFLSPAAAEAKCEKLKFEKVQHTHCQHFLGRLTF